MKKVILLVMFTLFSNMTFAADIDLNGDLSGIWRFSFQRTNGQKEQYDFTMTKSGYKLDIYTGKSVDFYTVSPQNVAKMDVFGAQIVEFNGKKNILWLRTRGPNDHTIEGTEVDGESNMILSIKNETISLGGDMDYEKEEIAQLTRLHQLTK